MTHQKKYWEKVKHRREVEAAFVAGQKSSRSPGRYGAWKPMETAPRDGRRIECWHVVHSCPVAVMYNEHGFPLRGERLHWQEATHTHSWPERAFSHWREISQPPAAP